MVIKVPVILNNRDLFVELLISTVSKSMVIGIDEILGKSAARDVVKARQIVSLVMDRVGYTKTEIQWELKRNQHNLILNYIDKAKTFYLADKEYRKLVDSIIKEINKFYK